MNRQMGWMLGVFGLVATPAFAFDLNGKIEIYTGGQALRASEAQEAIVYFRPKAPSTVKPLPEPAQMVTKRKDFVPHILPITVGSSVQFPNEDPILHNAFSTSKDNAFDTGVYGQGAGASYTFNHTGLVRVYCNVHHSMFAYVVVLDTPFYTRPGADGRFTLTGIPAGEGELVVFHDRGDPWRKRMSLDASQDVDVRLDLDRRIVPTHMNKFGQPYRPGTNANPY